MNEPQIMKVDEKLYNSGRREPFFWPTNKNLNFYEIRCNWGLNNQTVSYYHVLAYTLRQAEDMAKKMYARTNHISELWVKTFLK